MAFWQRGGWVAGFSLVSAACASVTPSGSSPEAFCAARVESFSNPEAGARGDFSSNVAFADLTFTSNSIGYGAAGERSDEITIADGVLHLARPDGAGGFQERKAFAEGEGGYMVQLVSPGFWRPSVTLEGAASLDELAAAIARAAQAAGCTANTKLAFRIEASVETADWSIDTLPQRGDFTTARQSAVIVGLYATVDQGKHFVVVGRNIHAHVVFPAIGVAGHLKALTLSPGGRLKLQGG